MSLAVVSLLIISNRSRLDSCCTTDVTYYQHSPVDNRCPRYPLSKVSGYRLLDSLLGIHTFTLSNNLSHFTQLVALAVAAILFLSNRSRLDSCCTTDVTYYQHSPVDNRCPRYPLSKVSGYRLLDSLLAIHTS